MSTYSTSQITSVLSAVSLPTTQIQNDSLSTTSYLTTSTTSIIACLTLMIGLMYLVVLSWGYRLANENPRPMNKALGLRVQKYAPCTSIPSPNSASFLKRRRSGLRLLGSQQSDRGKLNYSQYMTVFFFSFYDTGGVR